MTEKSFYWSVLTTGDGQYSPYDNDEFSDIWRKLFQRDRTTQGYIENYENELAVTNPSGSTIRVATGAALVDGKFYETDADVDNTVSTPAAATRVDRVVLRKSWAAQTVRVAIVTGVEGAGVPSLTQTDGVTWEIPLAQVSITIGGVITLTDEREPARSPLVQSTGTAFEEIQSIDGNGIITSFDFQSIPQTYQHLKIIVIGRIDTAALEATLQMRFNNDSSAIYNRQRGLASNTTASANAVTNQTEMDVGLVTGASGSANHASICEIVILNYANTTFYKSAQNLMAHIPNTTVGDFDIGLFGGVWKDVSAIDQVTIFNSAGGAFITGSRATLYGLN
jgi:hypothetical protein